MPRCGSTSIVTFCGQNNIQFFGGSDMGFWQGENTSQKLCDCVSSHVGKEVYDGSFTFTSVRNPYSRAVSMYKHPSWSSVKNFEDFCSSISKNEYPSGFAKWHSTTVSEHIFDDNDLKVDFVLKLENLQEDFNIVCDKIGIHRQELPHKNKSQHKHYTEYYNEETKQIVAEKYAKDIEYFGYKFGE